MSSNCIYTKAKSADELLHLTLQESYSLPVLTYAIAAIKLTTKQQRELNACWNMVYIGNCSVSTNGSLSNHSFVVWAVWTCIT